MNELSETAACDCGLVALTLLLAYVYIYLFYDLDRKTNHSLIFSLPTNVELLYIHTYIHIYVERGVRDRFFSFHGCCLRFIICIGG